MNNPPTPSTFMTNTLCARPMTTLIKLCSMAMHTMDINNCVRSMNPLLLCRDYNRLLMHHSSTTNYHNTRLLLVNHWLLVNHLLLHMNIRLNIDRLLNYPSVSLLLLMRILLLLHNNLLLMLVIHRLLIGYLLV